MSNAPKTFKNERNFMFDQPKILFQLAQTLKIFCAIPEFFVPKNHVLAQKNAVEDADADFFVKTTLVDDTKEDPSYKRLFTPLFESLSRILNYAYGKHAGVYAMLHPKNQLIEEQTKQIGLLVTWNNEKKSSRYMHIKDSDRRNEKNIQNGAFNSLKLRRHLKFLSLMEV
uniref:Uncharacterized protein n=1 Tax=Romanomermis culicivorax TaxID=13658 RepID=A0A915HQY1_ROMCU